MTKTHSEKACDAWMDDPLMIESIGSCDKTNLKLVIEIAKCSFMEGAGYAVRRCEDAGHVVKK